MNFTTEQLKELENLVAGYKKATNAASGSKFDQNANVERKTLAGLGVELPKPMIIELSRYLLRSKLTELYSEETADEFKYLLDHHYIYVNDESSLNPYCASVSLYPLLVDGLKPLGGKSKAPQNIDSFCGSFINLVYNISGQLAGAIATTEWLMYLDYFARKEWGDNYLNEQEKLLERRVAQVVYTLNEPAGTRGLQSVFWNISVFDEEYFKAMFGEFMFPDFTAPNWDTIKQLQEWFLEWLRVERTKDILTFPVVTAAMLTESGKVKDREFANMLANNMSAGGQFFSYQSDSADSLASCCRLRNEVNDNTFNFSIGATGVSTGSVKVITLNLPRIIQDNIDLTYILNFVYAAHHAWREIITESYKAGLIPMYDCGYISLDKQFSTIGINGFIDAFEYIRLHSSNPLSYSEYRDYILKTIFDQNKKMSLAMGFKFNTEMIPGESVSYKHYKWDKEDGYWVSPDRNLYSSYFYAPEDTSINYIDKFKLHGKEALQYLDGGSALHLNLQELPSVPQALWLLDTAAKFGCNYWCTNVLMTICNDCGNIDYNTNHSCNKCNSTNIDYATRIIGYLKKVSNFSQARAIEANSRFYHKAG